MFCLLKRPYGRCHRLVTSSCSTTGAAKTTRQTTKTTTTHQDQNWVPHTTQNAPRSDPDLLLGSSWSLLSRSWPLFGRSWPPMGGSWASWAALGSSWGALGPLLGALGSPLADPWLPLEHSWAALGPTRKNHAKIDVQNDRIGTPKDSPNASQIDPQIDQKSMPKMI